MKLPDKKTKYRGVAEYGFFPISTTKLFVLSVITFNFYNLYWFYRNWRTVQENDSLREDRKVKMSPASRALFSIFYAWPLFVRIKKDLELDYSAGLLAFIYVVLLLGGTIVARIPYANAPLGLLAILLAISTVVPLVIIQSKINYKQSANNTQLKRSKVYESILVIIGLVLCISSMAIYFSPSNNQSGSTVNPDVAASKLRMSILEDEYEMCSKDLESRYSTLNTYSQFAVDAYNEDYDNCENTRLRLNNEIENYNRLLGY